jgi:hypothetical protein
MESSGGGCISAWWSQGATAASEYVRQRWPFLLFVSGMY